MPCFIYRHLFPFVKLYGYIRMGKRLLQKSVVKAICNCGVKLAAVRSEAEQTAASPQPPPRLRGADGEQVLPTHLSQQRQNPLFTSVTALLHNHVATVA
jgi:hypothetical protein